VKNAPVILLLYVDDLFLTSVGHLIIKCNRELAFEFDMKDLGLMHYYLGLEVWQKPGEIFLGKAKYTIKILQNFGMMDCKSMATPMLTNFKKLRDSKSNLVNQSLYWQLIGSMYFVDTRMDICFAINTLNQFQVEPRHEHWIAAKHILRIRRNTTNYCLRYISNIDVHLQGYRDFDWAGSADDRKSTSGG